MIDMYLPIFEAKIEKLRQRVRELESDPTPDILAINQLNAEADKIEENLRELKSAA